MQMNPINKETTGARSGSGMNAIHDQISFAVTTGRIEWQKHSLARMLERGLSREAVKQTLLRGSIIENYPDDKPLPSVLVFGLHQGQPIHVVCAFDKASGYCFVITAYTPDSDHFGPDFRQRRT